MSSSKIIRRADLWYGKYRFCLRLYLNEAHCLRSYDDKQIAKSLDMRRRWGRRMMDTQGLFSPAPGSWRWQELEITAEDEANLYAMRDVLVDQTQPYHKHIAGDWMYIYSNDPYLLDQIQDLRFLDPSKMERSEIVQQGTPGKIQLKNPKYQYRTYLRDIGLEPNQRKRLQDWLAAQQDIKLSPSLSRWCTWDVRYLESYYFFDHDSKTILSMLGMIMPEVVRKTLEFEKAK